MKLIGYMRNNFTPEDGKTVTGFNLYLSYPLTGEEAGGFAVDRIYMTDAKLAQSNYKPKVGDEVIINYNRYGKVASIIPTSH